VGQIAKLQGCRAVGIAGGAKKCSYVTDELGFDACVDYKGGNLEEELKQACPNGIDVYFENVGGPVLDAVAPLLNKGSRVPICGYISAYNAESMDEVKAPADVLDALESRPFHRFFVVSEWLDEFPAIAVQLGDWVREGKLKYRETIVQGIENAPQAFLMLFSGENFGKLMIKVADADD
jgi:NADPH-dependent curcumin reductase CurA